VPALRKFRHPHIRLVPAPVAMFRNRMPRRLLATALWLALLVWAGGILWLSSLSPEKLPSAAFLTWDKLNHFVAFAVGGWLAASALRTSRPDGRTLVMVATAIILVAAFGAFDETVQLLTPGRTGADFYDWIADFLGAVAGAILSLLTHARLDRYVPRP
jgi:VanZ family protein